jgi:DNA-binding NtrC family response regulator
MLLPVLIISADPVHRDMLASITSSSGLRAVGSGTLAGARYFLAHQRFTAIVYEVPENEDFGTAVKRFTSSVSRTPIILVSRMDNWDCYLAAIAAGAFDHIDFPPYPGELERVLCLALSDSKHAWRKKDVVATFEGVSERTEEATARVTIGQKAP